MSAPIPDTSAEAAPGSASGLTDFLTDGALARLCDELGALFGIELQVRTLGGQRIVADDSGAQWIAREELEPVDARRIELRAEDAAIGVLLVAPRAGGPGLEPVEREARIERALALLATTVGELVENVLALRHRVSEVEALLRLSGLLARTNNVDVIINEALELALGVIGLDKGSIVLFPDDDAGAASDSETEVTLTASRGLSERWLSDPRPLSRGRLFDRIVRRGDVVVSEDLLQDDRVMDPQRAEREGVRSAINAGLDAHGRTLGVMRCYGVSPRRFTASECRVLQSIAQQTGIAVEQARLMQARERESRNQRQLQVASAVQRRMLPLSMPDLGFDIHARYQPSSDLGGDFYDAFEVGGGLGLAIGDVVGKGLPAALLMSAVRATLRAHVQDLYNLDEIIARVNKAMCRDTLESEFATLWYGVLEPGTRRLTYCSAGHEPPMILRVPEHREPTGADLDELTLGGMAVGIDPSQRYHRGIYDLEPGQTLIAYTDGATDMRDFEQRRFGKQRLRQAILRAFAGEGVTSSRDVVEHVMWELRQFAGLAPQADDITLVVVRV
ncbi:MAG: GAF domain-containing SpoIIE family protein phosphatase [Planctomycetota bacterium]